MANAAGEEDITLLQKKLRHSQQKFGTPPRKSFCLCISLPAGSPVNTSFQMQSAKRLSRLI